MEEIRDKNGLTEAEFLKTYNTDKYPKPSLTADNCIIAVSGEKKELLLVRRGGHPYLGCWALPGGFADSREALEDTAARELQEETGINCAEKGIELRLVGVYSKAGRDPRGWVVTAAYKAQVDRSLITVEAGDDAAEAAWFMIDSTGEETVLRNGDTVLSLKEDASGLAFDHAQIIRDALTL